MKVTDEMLKVEIRREDAVSTSLVIFLMILSHANNGDDWCNRVGPEHAPETIEPIQAPFEMPLLTKPEFPDRVFDIRDFGAKPDGQTKNTEAINSAIAACSQAGGGKVEIPPGTWLTGAIHLQSNVNLHLAPAATLRFSDDPNDYLPVVFTRWAGFECYNYSPLIYACDCHHIAITGEGKLDGNGKAWWPWFERQETTARRMYTEQILKDLPPERRQYGTVEDGLRPQFIAPIRCTDVLLEGFEIEQPGPFWTIDLTYCDRVIVRKLRVHTVGGPNTDGINVDSCRNVLIEYCFLETGDDCVCMKSGMNEDGWRVGRPTENVVVRYIRTGKGHGGAVFGSDTSGGIRNVYVHSCVFDGTDVGVRLKSTRGRGGGVDSIWIENIHMKNIVREAITINMAYRAWMGTTEGKAPSFSNLTFRNISCDAADRAVELSGLPESAIHGVRFENVRLRAPKGITADYVTGLTMQNVCFETKPEVP